MKFQLDNETISDLEIFSSKSGEDLFSFFNTARTLGGRSVLREMMQKPSCDLTELTERIELMRFFNANDIQLDITHHQVDFIEHYLNLNRRCLRDNPIDALYQHIYNKIDIQASYYTIKTGISHLLHILGVVHSLFNNPDTVSPKRLNQNRRPAILDDDFLRKILSGKDNLNCFQINSLDIFFRKKRIKEVKDLLKFIYEMDVFEAVAAVLKKDGWSLPMFTAGFKGISVVDVFHPNIIAPISNDISVSDQLVFLTGPNMAGKSSFLKAMSLAVYLSHLGFPVPAKRMESQIFDGLITTINLADNIRDGLSHYYSEIRRIKDITSAILDKKQLFIVIDELFRGTNPQDAFDGSLLIIRSFSMISNCLFFVSSHHTHLADELNDNDKVLFKCFEAEADDHKEGFSFKLKSGISHQRLGMSILQSEGLLEMLSRAVVESQTA